MMESVSVISARIVSHDDVADEALKAFCLSLLVGETVDEYISSRQIHFASPQVENTFLSHILALSDYALSRGLSL
ncbi:hypothetical protein [Parendozoicomonas sp. Alg238-R29]|uniref:hypothetical protein n=1 Tax=Parendozoicomonas sp. Alg238-R29 TaxID=2993446 RepID=UPI00248D5922|nr:hypothetical protein [Parendozoicomonas sp. Alg238-R29]